MFNRKLPHCAAHRAAWTFRNATATIAGDATCASKRQTKISQNQSQNGRKTAENLPKLDAKSSFCV